MPQRIIRTDPLDLIERTSDFAAPATGKRRIFGSDAGAIKTVDDAGNVEALAFARGNVVILPLPTVIATTKAGAFSDSDADADGFIGIDETNGRLYFRYGGTWVYAFRDGDKFSQTPGFDAGGDWQEETADLATPASSYRRTFARDSGGFFTKDDAGNVYALAFAGGNVAAQINEPRPASWQHKAGATGSSYGDLRIEWGNDTLSAGTKAVTFQKAFSGLLEVFLIDKTAANAMYPSALGTTGFTANGTGSDTFGWLAIGYDGR